MVHSAVLQIHLYLVSCSLVVLIKLHYLVLLYAGAVAVRPEDQGKEYSICVSCTIDLSGSLNLSFSIPPLKYPPSAHLHG